MSSDKLKKRIIVSLLFICLAIAGCGGKDNKPVSSETEDKTETVTEAEQESGEKPEETASAEDSASYFKFTDDGTTIRGLTEEGKKQTVLVIPAEAESLRGLSLEGAAVEEVSFAADHDVAIETAFTMASQVKKVTLPAELSEIPYRAFGNCTGIESIVIPAGVTKIDEYAFDCCSNLTEVKFDGTKCEFIGEYAFDSCGIKEITLPEGLKTLDEKAFFGCDTLTSVTLPSTIETIGAHAFNVSELSEAHFAADTENVTIDPTAFGTSASEMTVYIAEGSWMDQNRDSWNVGFGTIAYE